MPQFNIQLINQPAKLPDDPKKEEVVVQSISDGSTTSNIYESRAKYKVDVNKNNLPIGNFGSFNLALKKQEKRLQRLQEEYDRLLKFVKVDYPAAGQQGTESNKQLAKDKDITEAQAEILWNNNLQRALDLKEQKFGTTPNGFKFIILNEFEGIIPDLEEKVAILKQKIEQAPPNLRNQLDTWYERQTYGKLDYKGRAIISQKNRLTKINDTQFELQDFAAKAAESFLLEYNVERPTHPESKLNNIEIKRAYVEMASYDDHIDELYVSFFNEVLDPIKNTSKVKNLIEFSNLFYNWFIDQNEPVTDVGFQKREALNIYNSGLAFDYYNINTETDKQTILNDPRFPVINYVAKINGLKVDPNYPARLIADVYSNELINRHMPEEIKSLPPNDIPKAIFSDQTLFSRFFPINVPIINVDDYPFFGLDKNKIYKSIMTMQKMYNRLIKKYPNYINYTMSEDFKKKFETSKIKRANSDEGVLLQKKEQLGASVQYDINPFFIDLYIKLRAREERVELEGFEIKTIRSKMIILTSAAKIPNFFVKQESDFLLRQLRQTALQADNLLELFLQSKKTNKSAGKKGLEYSWSRAFAPGSY